MVARALYDDAFLPEYKFKSLQDILERPKLGEVDYISLDWKEEFHQKSIVPIAYFKFKELWDQTLLVAGFRQQERPYSMRVGAGGRLNGSITFYMALQDNQLTRPSRCSRTCYT